MKSRLSAALLCLATPGVALGASDVVVHRDPGCGCCEKWARAVQAKLGRKVVMRDDGARSALQHKAGMPQALGSCHSAVIDGYLFEGHVPLADMKRLLATRPAGVKGLAVAGMPLGSEGMEVAGVAPQPYSVISFGSSGQRMFARH
ncbi:DUF411 domain-containing protein [Sphingobium sp. H39-3-25]|uniref:DUF411 domain-containing protein n=1 Tax=Sphingobium arseniciresistens TaxID=3030834 RepID=UPI0023B8E3AA|nr:DUF411 domain-containing protein [Sphingobium arseniciresistens]